MYPNRKTNPEVRPQPERRRFSTDYKRRTVIEADQCRHGEMGALLRREGLTYTQVASWRKAHHDGTLVNKPRGPESKTSVAKDKSSGWTRYRSFAGMIAPSLDLTPKL